MKVLMVLEDIIANPLGFFVRILQGILAEILRRNPQKNLKESLKGILRCTSCRNFQRESRNHKIIRQKRSKEVLLESKTSTRLFSTIQFSLKFVNLLFILCFNDCFAKSTYIFYFQYLRCFCYDNDSENLEVIFLN